MSLGSLHACAHSTLELWSIPLDSQPMKFMSFGRSWLYGLSRKIPTWSASSISGTLNWATFFAATEPAIAPRIATDSSGRHRGFRVLAIMWVTCSQNSRGCVVETEETPRLFRGPIRLKFALFYFGQHIRSCEVGHAYHYLVPHCSKVGRSRRNSSHSSSKKWRALYKRRKTSPL